MSVTILGLGYIGLPTATIIASKNIKVYGVDTNPQVVNTINAGKIHIVEKGLAELVQQVTGNKMLTASLAPLPSNTYIVAVPTPFTEEKRPDISFVQAAVESTIPLLKKGDLLIIESTCPVGTTERMQELAIAKRPELKGEIYVAYCPERVLPGNVIYELEHNDRVIGGIDRRSSEEAASFYRRFVKGNLHITNSRTAELCKLTENAYRDTQIAFANELSIICDKANIDVWELIALANKHPRIQILQPGCGVGGHCIAVDPWFIVADYPQESTLIKKSREINDYKAEWCIEKITSACMSYELKNKKVPTVAYMGLSFKPNIDDLRESPAKYIATQMLKRYPATSLLVEPNISHSSTFTLSQMQEAYNMADIVVWLVKHMAFRTIVKETDKEEMDFCGINAKEV